MVWTLSIVSVYEVWRQSRLGGRWRPPVWVMAFEYGAVIAAAVLMRVSGTMRRGNGAAQRYRLPESP
jgi:hypothetical protein